MFTDEPYGCWIPESGVNNMQQMCEIFVAWIAWRIALEKEMLGKMPQKTWGHGRIVLVGWHTREVKSVSFSRGQSGSKTCWENWQCTSNQIGRKMRNAIIRDLLRLLAHHLQPRLPSSKYLKCNFILHAGAEKVHFSKRETVRGRNFKVAWRKCVSPLIVMGSGGVEDQRVASSFGLGRLIAHVGALVTGSRDGGDGREIVSRQRSQSGKNTPTLTRRNKNLSKYQHCWGS